MELLLAIALLTLLMVFMAQMLSAVSRTWADGERRLENYQNGRAVLDLIARELSPAVISEAHQLIQNPFSAAQQAATVPTLAPNSDSLFWQAPVSTSAGNELAEVGYYLTRDTSAGAMGSYQLKRFYVAQGHAKFLVHMAGYTPTPTQARWIASSAGTTFTASDFEAASSTVSDGVLGFWVRCLDVNGEPIPWFGSRSPEKNSAPHTKFNSAARFQPALVGSSGSSNAEPWPYTSQQAPAATDPAHRLPSAIELNLITLDSRTLDRRPNVPSLPAPADAAAVPAAIATYLNQTLVENRIQSARLFTSRVRLANGTQ